MTLEKHIELLDVGTRSYEELKQMQHRLNQERADGKRGDALIRAEVHPVIDFGRNPSKNRFSSLGLDYIRKHYGIDAKEINEKIIKLLNESRSQNISFSYSERGGGATVIMPGQYLYFPVVDLSNLNIRHLDAAEVTSRIDETMRQATYHLVNDQSKVKLASTGLSVSTGQESYDVAYDINGKLHKLGSKGIALVRYNSNGKNKDLLKGGFVFHIEKGSTDNFHLVDPCGIPLERVGVTTFEDILGKKIDKDYFNAIVHEAVKKHFYKQ